MTHTEQILVYKYLKASDGFGEYTPAAPVLQSDAPTWATIEQVSGDDLIISERYATALQFTVTCNWRDDFSFSRDMFIVSRFGNLDIQGIKESKRKRLVELDGIYIEGVDETGSGNPVIIGGLTTLYHTVVSDAATIDLPTIDGAVCYLLFRDGIEKTIVDNDPQVNEVQVSGSTLSLVAGDTFYAGERITILYQ